MKTGIPLALASAVLFGASTPFAKLLLGTVDPGLMARLLYLGAGLGLAILHLARGVLRLPAIEAPSRRPDLPVTSTISTNTRTPTHQANRIRIGTGMSGSCTGIRTIPIFIIDIVMSRPEHSWPA